MTQGLGKPELAHDQAKAEMMQDLVKSEMMQGLAKGDLPHGEAKTELSQEHNKFNASNNAACLNGVGPSCETSSAQLDSLTPYQFQQYQWQHFAAYQQFAAASQQPSHFGIATPGTSGISGATPLYQHWPNYGSASKKGRQTYHRHQTAILEARFQQSDYVTKKQREELRNTTNLSDRQIKIWFQNRRMKKKKEKNRTDDQSSEHTPLMPPNPHSKSSALSIDDPLILHNQIQQHQQHRNSPSSNGNLVMVHNEQQQQALNNGGISTATPTIGGLDSITASAFSTSLMTSSSSTPTSLMKMDTNDCYQSHLLNSQNSLFGSIENDKLKSCHPMPFGLSAANPQSMASMYTPMNSNNTTNTNNGMMMPHGNGIINTNNMTNSSALGMGMNMTSMMMDPFLLSQQFPQSVTSPMINQSSAAGAANPHGQYPYHLYST